MTGKIIALAGPLKGQIIELAEEKTSIGRDGGNMIALNDTSTSRQHCCILAIQDMIVIRDLESENGTIVNGVSVTEARLEHGDRVQIGNSRFIVWLSDEEFDWAAAGTDKDEINLDHYDSVLLRREDSVYLCGDDTIALPAESNRVVRDLRALFRITSSINVVRGSDALQQRLLDLIFEVIPAERGAILLVGHNPEVFVSEVCKVRNTCAQDKFKASRTVTRRVLREGVAVLSNEVPDPNSGLCTDSLTLARVHSLICVPLSVYDTKLGVMYLDTSDLTTRFDEGHQQLLTAIGAIAAVTLEHARYDEWLENEKKRLEEKIDLEHKLMGQSRRVAEINELIRKFAPQETNVLIRGESGTGKELVATLIHQNSKRARGPFVAINCGAINPNLLENELFGHEKEGFSGAETTKKGKIEAATGGTLFLDEIGDMPKEIQKALLRVLEKGRDFQRVGGTETIRADIRLICATNKNLEQAVRSGTFREDLYFRINVAKINLPPLRERLDDVPRLVDHFLEKCSKACSKIVQRVSPEVLSILSSYDWPGNIRELENVIEVAVVMCSTNTVQAEDLPEYILQRDLPVSVRRVRFHEAVTEFKRQLIVKTVMESKFVYVDAAKCLGIHPNNLHRVIRELNLKEKLKQLEQADLPS